MKEIPKRDDDKSQNESLILAKTENGRYIIFAESEDEDKVFWSDVIKQFAPEKAKNKYKITVLLNSGGKKQNGVYEIRKFLRTTRLNLAEQNVLFCIDSDANYLLKDELTQNKSYILQTYTYSIENHKSIPENLNRIVEKYEIEFDVKAFLSEYSKIVYDFFLYWLAIKKIKFPIQEALATTHIPETEKLEQIKLRLENLVKPITKEEHEKVIEIGNTVDIANNGQTVLNNIQNKVANWKVNYATKLVTIDIEQIKKYLVENNFIISPEETYLYIRGHNLFGENKTGGVILALLAAISDNKRQSKKQIEQDIDNMQLTWQETWEKKKELYALLDYEKMAHQSYQYSLIHQNSELMNKIQEDVQRYFKERNEI
jgi:hypothetical protein